MKFSLTYFGGALALFISAFASGPVQAAYTIEDYNNSLPFWGTTWTAGGEAIEGYYPSFYTGFAMRSRSPERIHVRTGRGNNTRVTMILDDASIGDYLFDLVKRYRFYKSITNGNGRTPIVNNRSGITGKKYSAAYHDQVSSFYQIIDSEAYGIQQFVASANAGRESRESIYRKSLEVFTALNQGRVFYIRLDLTKEFNKWKSQMREMLANVPDTAAYFTKNPSQTIIAINSVVFGRVDFTAKPNADQINKLVLAANLAREDGNDDLFVAAALDLFKSVTGTKYEFNTMDRNGQWDRPIKCASAANCFLVYPEFTAVYPTGSASFRVRDQYGNSIPGYTTRGLWKFLYRKGSHDVDNIRQEQYYGWIPKLDYQGTGNGYHNPAVRNSLSKDMKKALNVPENHKMIWAITRGEISHGCLRLPAGHAWELRHIMPSQNLEAIKIYMFANLPTDFDVFDINGDGNQEVMGVNYTISYKAQGQIGLERREGKDFDLGSRKPDFYAQLYGRAGNVYTANMDGSYTFNRPTISMPSYLDFQKSGVKTRLQLNSSIPLYEQHYERDKVQFFLPIDTYGMMEIGNGFLSKRIVRLMGRVRGCAPGSDKEACGENGFDREWRQIVQEAR